MKAFNFHSTILSGSAFRMALRFIALFIVMLVLVGLVLVRLLSHSLEDELVKQTNEEVVLFRDIYEAKGAAGLVSVINDLAQSTSVDNARGLFDAKRQHLAGQVSLAPDFIGLQKTTLIINTQQAGEHTGTFHVIAVQLDKMLLVVGRSTQGIEDAEKKMIFWLVISGLGLSLGTLLLGYFTSIGSFRKLQTIDQTLQAVSNGDMQARIKITADNDQIDHIALQLNHHLERLSDLVSGMKTTASAIAHDLKTPLSHARISLFKALELCDPNLPSNQSEKPDEAIADALDELEQLNQTFDTILRISRIQTQTDRADFETFDVVALIEKVVDLLAPVADEAGMKLGYEEAGLRLRSAPGQHTEPRPEPGDPHTESERGTDPRPERSRRAAQLAPVLPLKADAGMIQQLLVNLINNAIIYCPKGSRISVSAEPLKNQLILIVQDNGAGIPPAEREAVFESFKRLDNARTLPGNGLGLALVKAIVVHHQATISLEDAQPGLLVRVSFPT